jgi:hypothetical protein
MRLVAPPTIRGPLSERSRIQDLRFLITAVVNDPEQMALRDFVLIDAALPPKTVQNLANHSSVQVTMDRYGHLGR